MLDPAVIKVCADSKAGQQVLHSLTDPMRLAIDKVRSSYDHRSLGEQ